MIQSDCSVPMDVVHDFDIGTDADDEGAKEGEKEEFLSTGLMTSKLNRLVEELRKLQKSDSTAKCLVFSQFTQVSVAFSSVPLLVPVPHHPSSSGRSLRNLLYSTIILPPTILALPFSPTYFTQSTIPCIIPSIISTSSPPPPPHALLSIFQTLSWLQVELPKYGFSFRTLLGSMTMACRAKALADFQVSI